MKKIGEYTTRGQFLSDGTAMKRIQLFDGSFDTGYRVVWFEVAMQDRADTSAESISAKLTTEITPNQQLWDWGDNREIAWATASNDANSIAVAAPTTIIDPDNLIIEDLYIGGYSYSDSETINYIIHLHKYSFTDWRGALAMVRNRSQS